MNVYPAQVAARDRSADRLADHPGKDGKLDSTHECQGEERVPPSFVRASIAPNAADETEFERGAILLSVLQIPEVRDCFPGVLKSVLLAHECPPGLRAPPSRLLRLPSLQR